MGSNDTAPAGAGDSVTGQAARFVAALEPATIPAPVLDKARACVLYGFGIGLLCLRQETARVAAQAVLALDGEAGMRGATALAGGERVPVASAAFANAVLLHSRCQEDTSGTAHLGVAVLAVALALLEAGLADEADFLPAVVAGYEVGGTLEAALGRETMVANHRASPLYGTLAAAATAARLLRLAPERIDAALANAAQFTGGTLQSIPEGSDEWRYQVGAAARSGLLAALLARAGSVSAQQSIEGPQGFVQAFARRAMRAGEFDFGPERRWRLPDVTFKPYPVCAHNQTVALLGARVHQEFRPAEIAALTLRFSNYLVPGLLARGPFTRVADTLMSSAFCCACAAVHGTVSMAGLASFDDPAILGLMARTEVVPDAAVPYPAALAEIRLHDGRTVQLAERRAFADFSLGRAEVLRQLRRLAAEEDVPEHAVALLDAWAFSATGCAPPGAVADAFALARAGSRSAERAPLQEAA